MTSKIVVTNNLNTSHFMIIDTGIEFLVMKCNSRHLDLSGSICLSISKDKVIDTILV